MDEDQEPHERFGVTATCACADRVSVDLVAVLKGRKQALEQDFTDYREFGASFDR